MTNATQIQRIQFALIGVVVYAVTALPALAGPMDEAKRMFERLTLVSPNSTQLQQMTALVAQGNREGAAQIAMADPAFFNVGLKRFFTPRTSGDGSADGDLNDATALLILAARDNMDFRRVLFDDVYAVGPATTEIVGDRPLDAQTKMWETPDAAYGPTGTVHSRCCGEIVLARPDCAPAFRVDLANGHRCLLHFGPPNGSLQAAGQVAYFTPAQIRDAFNQAVPGIASLTADNKLRLHYPHGFSTAYLYAHTLGFTNLMSPALNRSFQTSNNSHYVGLQWSDADLSRPEHLVLRSQRDHVLATGVSSGFVRDPSSLSSDTQPVSASAAPEPAGVLTTRAWGALAYQDGTNRRAVKYLFENFMCRSLASLKDFTMSDHLVRRDVTRSPGGNSAQYLGDCVGCHAGMDAMAGAFAHLDYRGTSAPELYWRQVQNFDKNNRNADVFPLGSMVFDSSWQNLWAHRSSADLGFAPGSSSASGRGPSALGRVIAESEQFSRCQVKQVFDHVCRREMSQEEQDQLIPGVVAAFRAEGHRMKTIFRKVAAACLR